MNKWQKEVLESLLSSEAEVLNSLDFVYSDALSEIMDKVKQFDSDIAALTAEIAVAPSDKVDQLISMRQSKIYQKQYQEALQGQISGILDKMYADSYSTIDDYLHKCYENGYTGTMYELAKQGIPVLSPISQPQVVKAVLTNSKVSHGLYSKLGIDVNKLKKKITWEVSRGISEGLSYADIARNLNNSSGTGLSNAKRIARTEGHRIQNEACSDAQHEAKAKGADVLKQWDATLDGLTRESHRIVDGEIKELDDKFSNGLLYPGDSENGSAAEVCNCRCALLTRARWALDEEELQTLKDRAEYFGLDKTDNFEDFKDKYLEASSDMLKSDAIEEAYFERAEEALKHMTPQESKADWGSVFGIDEEASDALNNVHSDLNKHMIQTHTEKAFLFSVAENKALDEAVGNINGITITKRFKKVLKASPANSIILSHVHPSNGSFSFEDIEKLVSNKSVKALTLELPNGQKYILNRGLFKTTVFSFDKFEKAYDEAEKEARSLFKIFENDMSKDLPEELHEEFLSVWDEYVHKRNEILADKLGMKYELVKNNGK